MDEESIGEIAPDFLASLKGLSVSFTEVAGGYKYARRILIAFEGGRTLWIEPELNMGITGISPTLKYGTGEWGGVV